MTPELRTSTAICKATQWQNQPRQWAVRRKEVAHLTPWGWGKGFSCLGDLLGSKNDGETKPENPTKKPNQIRTRTPKEGQKVLS